MEVDQEKKTQKEDQSSKINQSLTTTANTTTE